MKVLVTGCAGFIGFHLADALLKLGTKVVGLDNLNDYYDPDLKHARLDHLNRHSDFEFSKADLVDRVALSAVFARGPFDAVVHLAAQAGVRYSLEQPAAYVQSNLVGFLTILEECRQHQSPHLVYASSSSVYGLNSRTPFSTADGADHPASLYAATKKSNELMAHSYSHLFRLPTTGLRFFTVYGPWGRPDMAYYQFTRNILAGRPINIFNHGEMWRDFTYIDDIVESIVRLLPLAPKPDPDWDPASPKRQSSSAPYRIFNIGNHQPVKLTEFIACLEQILDRKAKLLMKPIQPGDVISTCADTTELFEATGFAPKTSLDTGLRRFVEWYHGYHRC